MSMKSIERREARLLRWEAYLRRSRHVAFWFGLFCLFGGMFGVPHIDPPESRADAAPLIWTGLFCLLVAYEAHLKVRHIESIRHHAAIEAELMEHARS